MVPPGAQPVFGVNDANTKDSIGPSTEMSEGDREPQAWQSKHSVRAEARRHSMSSTQEGSAGSGRSAEDAEGEVPWSGAGCGQAKRAFRLALTQEN